MAKCKQYVPLTEARKLKHVDFTTEKVYVAGAVERWGGAYITSVEQGPFSDEVYAEIKIIKNRQAVRVPLSRLLILETVEENKTEENIMLFKGYKVAVVAPTENITKVACTEKEHTVMRRNPSACHPLDPYGVDVAFYGDLKIGDFVAYVDKNGIVRTARVSNIIEDTTVNGLNIRGEVLDIIDTTAYADRCQRAVEAERLKRQMDVEVERMKEQAAYDSFAEKNPFLSEMLTRYKSIMGDDTEADNKKDAE